MNLKNNKLVESLSDLKSLYLSYKSNNKKVVMTNGCFDILHSGHTYILEESKKLGDILIVALNSDLSVRKIKSKDRPIVGELDRAYVLSCLSAVDHIILFDDDSPENIICEILPEILVKGSDYKGKKVAGEDCLIENGKKVVLIDLIEGKSSTSIIDKVSKI
ncbi:MAG: adenylyltransferase/cytidyltransferase family protein [Gammaproteobacteria bacterium]|jgi:rfaE bifunctional protein nucleotidyltransferase chain/domain|nr:adenylyltransferase/cytidyltransferase family protein [Gammaproteobacteria bacterium]MBT5644566.1 adenylyltransferase/cytidyltransferase family protein [Gammaproteobacteria bacterium]MBT5863484.1 adenylyltransferase/cytidyltransferase family protein [Gammaproteobacteria bacterium]MBT6733915.1 adenylyltransferase/cytidyltransferase family protein [Gammaproteobacteria bacterium]MBT7237027.1 adenylyltransferase/cytidyltransferase family protein [Gammaproteobacteria bacterium]|tara:strand:- start:1701 stop:2186 length:486 start_codon:yes stop_codon:yes gene_type:complete